ncbi:MAG TPA: acetamidase/formamidase family protein [Planctomycetota bacterium]|nr:acetamidase/formamidase family protein [Planctomycetota bacterium]
MSLSPVHPPVARVKLGSAFTAHCPSAMGGLIGADGKVDQPSPKCNAMSGPVWVEGVKAGDVIAVAIEAIEPVGFGLAQQVVYRRQGKYLEFLNGVRAAVEPSLGCLGVAPRLASDETFNDTCGAHGGNIDCRDWAPGATAFFRARVDGANLGVGDVHWAMGDGEIGGQGIEGAADVRLRVTKPAGLQRAGVEWPWLIRDGFLMTIGGHPDLKTAQRIAYEEMMVLCRNLFNLERSEVQARIACLGQLRVCQACCPVITVRVCLSLGVLGKIKT